MATNTNTNTSLRSTSTTTPTTNTTTTTPSPCHRNTTHTVTNMPGRFTDIRTSRTCTIVTDIDARLRADDAAGGQLPASATASNRNRPSSYTGPRSSAAHSRFSDLTKPPQFWSALTIAA